MSTTINLSISISSALFNQIQLLAQHLNLSQDDLVELAVEHFIKTRQDQLDSNAHPNPSEQDTDAETPIRENRTAIHQGDLYWLRLESLHDVESNIPHPHVVLQPTILNQSRLDTVIVCGLTSNVRRANAPGNVLLDVGEANLSRQSIVEVSKVSTVDKIQLGDFIGSLSEQRINQIFAGMRLLQQSFFTR
jgi:mRNA interferase MazF